jgi:hypothetical protein
LEEKTGFALGELQAYVDRGIQLGEKYGIESVKTFRETTLGGIY